TSSAVGLGAVPPSSDPQRLLSYVLNIMPQYTSMELSTTHFRLYNQHLRLELEQVRQTLEFMQERAHDEEDKRLFLEKYASEVVKERNELLHHKGKKSHKLWHNCCRKHASYDLDVTPSIASLRGEKLTEVGLQLKQNMQALQEKDRLLQTAQHLAHTKQIELDAHMSSCRKERYSIAPCILIDALSHRRDQLHDYIAQISGLQTAQERQLYEAQSQLAVEVEANDKSHGEIDQLHRRLEQVEGQLEEQSAVLADKDSQIQHLTHLLENAADVERQLQDECRRLAHPGRHAEIEALHSQVEALQTADMTQLTRKYTKHIQMLQDQLDKQSRTIDGLEQELHRFRPMTLDDMSDKDTPPSVAASSWHDSLGSVSQYSRSFFPPIHTMSLLLGVIYATLTNTVWGCYPLYWKRLAEIPALQITAHRIVWSFVLLELLLVVTGRWKHFHTTAFTRLNIATGALSGTLVGSHWLLWVWAVNRGFIVQASLGSFMIPLATMFLGMLFLKERFRLWQWVGMALAIGGVTVVAVGNDTFPWVSFVLALTFGLYGLVKKQTKLDAIEGMTLEFAIMSIPSLTYLVVAEVHSQGVFSHVDVTTDLLLVGGGAITAIPYVWFSTAALRLPMTILGIFGYIVPTGNLLIGVFVYHEPFSTTKLAGFVLIWIALAVFSVESLLVPPASVDGKDQLPTSVTHSLDVTNANVSTTELGDAYVPFEEHSPVLVVIQRN
ncbi:hypothetical protein DYB25_011981, partial [Aphanomyces astaci]